MLSHTYRRPPDSPGWKRAIDLVLCFLALPLLVLTTAAMAVLMSLYSRGPILFYQERVGYKGRRFNLLKFRTMHVCADPGSHRDHIANLVNTNAPMKKMDGRGDRRMIPGAWIIRALGLDELPQLINVLRGEMSIVGPRPCIAYEYEQFSSEQRARVNAVPGLTGLWQVSGKNRTTFCEMIALDLDYIRRRSLAFDLKIIALTPYAITVQAVEAILDRKSSRLCNPTVTATAVVQPSASASPPPSDQNLATT